MPLQIRRGSTADRLSIVPLVGELVFDTTTGAVFVGNGTTAGGLPVTAFGLAESRDATAKMFLGESLTDNSIHSGITFQYVANRLIATVGNIDFDETIETNIVPAESDVYNLGSPTKKFKDLYLSGDSLYLGDAVITANTDGSVNLPAGTLIGGSPAGIDLGQTYEIDIVGSVFSTTSGQIIDSATSNINANVINANQIFSPFLKGDINGSVYSDTSTVLVDSANGFIPAEVVQGIFSGDVVGQFTGGFTSIGNSTAQNLTITNQLTCSISTGEIPTFISNRSPVDGTTYPALDLRVTAGNTSIDSGPELVFTVNTSAAPATVINLSRIRSTNIDYPNDLFLTSYGQLSVDVWNGAAYVNTIKTAQNVVVLNEKLTFYKNTITTGFLDPIDEGFMIEGVADYDNGDINIVPSTETVQVFGNVVPGQYGDSTAAKFDLGSNSLKWETLHVESVRSHGFVKFPVYADSSARDTALPSPEAGMVVFVTDVTQLQVNTNGTTGGWVTLN